MIRRAPNGAQVPTPPDPFRLARDRATDQSNETVWADLGLEENPQGADLGNQVASAATFVAARTGRPARWRTSQKPVLERRLDVEPRPANGGGTIRRNIVYPPNGQPGSGMFSWAANRNGELGRGPFPQAMEPSRVADYYQSSLFLGLPDSAPWAITDERPQPGLARFQSRPTVQTYGGTGWPVLAPSVPSFGSRVPLRRPRTLLAGIS